MTVSGIGNSVGKTTAASADSLPGAAKVGVADAIIAQPLTAQPLTATVDGVDVPKKLAAAEQNPVVEGALDVLQVALDGAGFVPGLGEASNLASAGVSALRRDNISAALSIVSMIPGVGDAVAAPLKYALKLGLPISAAIAGPVLKLLRQHKGEMLAQLSKLNDVPGVGTHLGSITNGLKAAFATLEKKLKSSVKTVSGPGVLQKSPTPTAPVGGKSTELSDNFRTAHGFDPPVAGKKGVDPKHDAGHVLLGRSTSKASEMVVNATENSIFKFMGNGKKYKTAQEFLSNRVAMQQTFDTYVKQRMVNSAKANMSATKLVETWTKSGASKPEELVEMLRGIRGFFDKDMSQLKTLLKTTAGKPQDQAQALERYIAEHTKAPTIAQAKKEFADTLTTVTALSKNGKPEDIVHAKKDFDFSAVTRAELQRAQIQVNQAMSKVQVGTLALPPSK